MYPEIKTNQQFWLEVAPPHSLYVEESGSAEGIPVVFLHGGPGAGTDPAQRRFFDPNRYRIILFDQRGAGRSRPHASLESNTTTDLVADLELLRDHLGIKRWLVFGGSWGSTLALVYAQTHPERVLGLVLRGIFLCRPSEIDWFYQSGTRRLFPDYFKAFEKLIPEDERGDLVAAYHRRLTGDDELARMAAAKAWSRWEAQTACLAPNRGVIDALSEPRTALAMARIESHYFVNNSFLAPNQILDNADRLAGIPGEIIHGRYDVICPLENALALHEVWPDSRLSIVAEAGHAAGEPGIARALIAATDHFARVLD